MSKTITKKLDIQVTAENIFQAFALLDLPILQDAPFRLFGRASHAELVIPDAVIQQLGLPRLRFSDGIGLHIQADGSVNLEYDHYNAEQAACIEKFLAGLNAIGAHAQAFENYKAQGYTIQPVVEQQELGIFIGHPQGTGSWQGQSAGGWSW